MTEKQDKSASCNGIVTDGEALSQRKHNKKSTAHANVMLRTPIFVPMAVKKVTSARTTDLTDPFRDLTLLKTEGYERVRIYGPQLDIERDFRTWVGIIRVFEQDGFRTDEVEIPFKTFAALCGHPTKQLSSVLRERIDGALIRIMSQVIILTKANGSNYKTHLVQKSEYNKERDVITLKADPSLWELYRVDHNILLSLETQEALRRREVAQCLYMFIEALPPNPVPLSFARLRDRLMLTTASVAEANRSIAKALVELKNIGYLEYELDTVGRERYVLIQKRKSSFRCSRKG